VVDETHPQGGVFPTTEATPPISQFATEDHTSDGVEKEKDPEDLLLLFFFMKLVNTLTG